MSHLHPFHIQRFQANESISTAQFIGKMPMIGFSLINNSAMQTSLLLETLLDIFTFMNWSFVDRSKTFSFLHKVIGIGKKFTRYFFLHLLEFIAILLEESWHIYIIFLCWSNKNMVFKAKIKPDTFTQSRNDSILFHLTNKENVDVAYGVSLNRYGLDGSFDFSGLVVIFSCNNCCLFVWESTHIILLKISPIKIILEILPRSCPAFRILTVIKAY